MARDHRCLFDLWGRDENGGRYTCTAGKSVDIPGVLVVYKTPQADQDSIPHRCDSYITTMPPAIFFVPRLVGQYSWHPGGALLFCALIFLRFLRRFSTDTKNCGPAELLCVVLMTICRVAPVSENKCTYWLVCIFMVTCGMFYCGIGRISSSKEGYDHGDLLLHNPVPSSGCTHSGRLKVVQESCRRPGTNCTCLQYLQPCNSLRSIKMPVSLGRDDVRILGEASAFATCTPSELTI